MRKIMKLAGLAAIIATLMFGTVTYALFPIPPLSSNPTPTGYYLPRGYKAEAIIMIPPAPFWPGIAKGDVVGVDAGTYQVRVVGFGYKASIIEGFWACHGVQVQKHTLSKTEILTMKTNQDNPSLEAGEHKITITYGYDGTVKIAIDGEFLYSFAGTEDKYAVIAEGAKVSAPEPLPSSDSGDTGEGYNPPTVKELQLQYLALGAGVGAIAIVAALLALRGRRNAAALLLLLALCAGSALAAAAVSADELAYVVVNPDGTYSIEGYVELSSSWDFGALKIVRAIYYPDSNEVELHFYWYGDDTYPYLGIGHSTGSSGYILESGIPPSQKMYEKVYELRRDVGSYPYIDFYMAMNPGYGGPQLGKVAIADFEKATATPSPTTTTSTTTSQPASTTPSSAETYSVNANAAALAAGAGVAAVGVLAALALARKR